MRIFLALLITVVCSIPLFAVELPSALAPKVRRYLKTHSAGDRAPVASLVLSMQGAPRDYAHLAIGIADHDAKNYERAIANLRIAARNLDEFQEYAVYYLGRSYAKSEQLEPAVFALKDFSKRYRGTRLAPYADQLRAEGLLRLERFDEAAALLAKDASSVFEPARLYLNGRLLELTNRRVEAVESHRRVYYFHPTSESAQSAEDRLNILRRELGARYPEAPADWRLARADRLFDRSRFGPAADEYRRSWDGLSGADLQRAKLRYAAANYRRLHTTTAYNTLSGLKLDDPELAAERLYYLGECARRKGRISEFERRADELKAAYPDSKWYEELLFSLGNYYLLENNGPKSRKFYQRAAEEAPQGQHAVKAHWKVCWRAYLDDDPRSRSLFEEHVRRYPSSPNASAAMFWIGRIEEKGGDPQVAKALYAAIQERFPHYYYAMKAEQRLREIGRPAGAPPELVASFTAELPAPRRLDAVPGTDTAKALKRGRLLFALGLDKLSERELLLADYRPGDAFLVGLELSKVTAARDDYFQGLRYMKRYGYGYLRMPLSIAPRDFWERLYPMPWEAELRRRAAPHKLDPYLVAGLIRQESEYNQNAVSRAGAIGLMQIMPRTGRELFQRLGIPNFSTRKLRVPDISLRLGTFHLKEVLQQFQGSLELALAAYNAGGHRANQWITWAEFDEPGEFVETIPFTETRGYVQSVLRNRQMYRLLYDDASLAARRADRAE